MVKTICAAAAATVLFALSNVASAQAGHHMGSTHTASSTARSMHSHSDPAGYPESASVGHNAFGGGVGVNARAKLSHRAAPDHNVKLVFSLNTGNYLADVHVSVLDPSGKTVIEGVAPGPWLYAKLTPGSYTVNASYMGETVTQKLTVNRSGQRVAHLRWPASVEMQASASEIEPVLGTGIQQEPQR